MELAAVTAFLSDTHRLSERGVAIPFTRAAALTVDIAAGQIDALARGVGRIVAEDRRALRLTGLEPDVRLWLRPLPGP